ncbi:MAG: flippase-like domain-containing protein [Thermoflavifilum aggregans]|nr:flippase-like domain-containing protein [Thermoflavifilum aggregans]
MPNKSTKIILNTFISVGLFAGLSFLIYRQLQHQQNLALALEQIRQVGSGHRLVILIALLLLVVPNWLIEARKWQLLLHQFQPVSLFSALQSVLIGVSLGINTPNRIGEYAGRIMLVKTEHRLEAASVMVLSSLSQLMITMGFGLLGLGYEVWVGSLRTVTHNRWLQSLWVLLCGVCLVVGVLYFRKDLMVAFFAYFRRFRFLIKVAQAIRRVPGNILLQLVGLSAIRYLIFSTQFLALLRLLGASVPWVAGFFSISLIYVIMAFLPTMALAEIGIRGELNIYFLSPYTLNTLAIVSAAVVIWLINLILPAIVGSMLWLKVKMIRRKT